jgi:hypothetical protein
LGFKKKEEHGFKIMSFPAFAQNKIQNYTMGESTLHEKHFKIMMAIWK